MTDLNTPGQRKARRPQHAAALMGSLLVSSFVTGAAHAQAGLPAVITLRTLAQVQQMQDEKLLNDKINGLMQRSQADARPSSSAKRSKDGSDSQNGAAVPTAVATADVRRPAQKKRPTVRVLSVYGPAGQLSAEAVDSSGRLHALSQSDPLDRWVVTHIRQEGVLLHRQADTRHHSTAAATPADTGIFVRVGESMDDGSMP